MSELPPISRRQALALGAGVLGAMAIGSTSLANASVSGTTNVPGDETGFTGYWHGPDNPYNDLRSPQQGTLVRNGSFEEPPEGPSAPGAEAPGWTFAFPPT